MTYSQIMQKSLKGILALSILSLFLLNGCSLIEYPSKVRCQNSGGKWHPGYISPAGSNEGWCDCSGLGGKATKIEVGKGRGVECLPLDKIGLVCCADRGGFHWADTGCKSEEGLKVVEDSLC